MRRKQGGRKEEKVQAPVADVRCSESEHDKFCSQAGWWGVGEAQRGRLQKSRQEKKQLEEVD